METEKIKAGKLSNGAAFLRRCIVRFLVVVVVVPQPPRETYLCMLRSLSHSHPAKVLEANWSQPQELSERSNGMEPRSQQAAPLQPLRNDAFA